jgi:hypothetical protein
VDARPAIALPSLPRVAHALPGLRPFPGTRHASHLRGVVLDEAGVPVADAELFIHRVLAGSDQLRGHVPQRTAADGSFDIAVGPGEYLIYASSEHSSSELIGPLALSLTEELSAIELRLAPGNSVEGHLVDKSGEPAGDAVITLALGEPGFALDEQVEVDDDGHFERTSLPRAPVRLRAFNTQTAVSANVALPSPQTGLTVTLDQAAHPVAVTVRDESGAPVSDAMLYASALDLPHGNMVDVEQTDIDGKASLQLGEAKVRIEVQSDHGAIDPIVVPPSQTQLDITLHAGAHLKGRLRRHENMLGYSALFVVEGDSSMSQRNALTIDEEGRFEIAGLRPGRYELVLYRMLPPRNNDVDQRYVSLAEITLRAGEVRDLGDLDEPPTGTLRGVVRMADGSALPTDVHIETEDPRGGTSVPLLADIDAQGRFELPDVPRGMVLWAVVGDDGSDLGTLNAIAEPDGAEVVLTLVRYGHLNGSVRGLPTGPTRVRCDGDTWGELDDDGAFDLLCAPGQGFEIIAGNESRRFAPQLTAGETSYAELTW